MSEAVTLEVQDVVRLGDDLKITGRPAGPGAVEPGLRKE